MSGPWFALPVHFFGSDQERALSERWGWSGVVLWLAFMAACKRAEVEGQVRFHSEHEHLAELGLLGRELLDADGKPFSLEDFYRWTGRHHWTTRLRRSHPAIRLQDYDRLQRYRVYPRRPKRRADNGKTTDIQTTPARPLTSSNAPAKAAQASDNRQTTDTQTRNPQVRGQKRGRNDVPDRTHVGTTTGGTSGYQRGRGGARRAARRAPADPPSPPVTHGHNAGHDDDAAHCRSCGTGRYAPGGRP